ncbi:hypothetical protein [Paenibacillus protaetiae]|uniref:Uncharacterized protein n=1 Tax=Paenibacillus protaetiae TaxID=2509456 RepID=A0A4P6ETW5_9BACL|nr:hypothetical protein [Paenibacillus protaetiae]QAY66354.1 hypothetical protein ET464_07985 [Paenibacillus protaetiae]
MEEFEKRIYKPGDLADCYTFAMDDNMTTIKYQLRLIEKVEDLDANWGEEIWTTIQADGSSNAYNRSAPLDKLDWDAIGEPEQRTIVTNAKYLNRLEHLAKNELSYRELMKDA